MIQHPAFSVEPWALPETELHFATLAQTESLFALSNGHIGVRGNLDEGEPHGLPGTYLNGFFEQHPLPYAEIGYGFPTTGQTLLNVTNGKLLRLMIEDEPLDLRYGQLRKHRRVLDFRAGTLTRSFEWISPAGCGVRVSSTRLVSLTHRSIVAICYRVEALDRPVRLLLQSELIANEQLPERSADPRAAVVLDASLVSELSACAGASGMLVHRTQRSARRLAAAMDHEVRGSQGMQLQSDREADLVRVTILDEIAPGQALELVKYVAYGWTHSKRSITALRDQVTAALGSAKQAGWEALRADQRKRLDEFWERADVQIDGDPELQQAVRFALFHVFQAAARAERAAIPAKGLTGSGYDGHCFWDTEMFVLPALIHTAPQAAADALSFRHATLEIARRRAAELGLRGAAFSWRTIHGEECSGYWPAGTAAFHINAAIGDAVIRYVDATDDRVFERDIGLDLLIETARLFRSLGQFDTQGSFRIDGVTGPDEYSAIADNNVYTNLMAQRVLRGAANACERFPTEAQARQVTADEMEGFRDAADQMFIPYNQQLGVHEQAEGFTRHAVWSFEQTRPDQYPLLLHFPYFELYRKQVVKQPDLVLAMQVCSDAFSSEQKARNFAYYERLTVRDSSLSACTQAVLATEVGQLRLALDYATEAALIDLQDLQHNTRDGLHLASLAGTWIALVAGFGGMRDHGAHLVFRPRVPDGVVRLSFRLVQRGLLLEVTVTAQHAQYRLLAAEGHLHVAHYDELVVLQPGAVVERSIPAIAPSQPLAQPPGRAPVARLRSLPRNQPP